MSHEIEIFKPLRQHEGDAELIAWIEEVQQKGTIIQSLDLTFTKITGASLESLSKLKQLQSLYLERNQVRTIDPAIIESINAQQIFAALRGLTLPIARILFVGTGNIGKTFLFERCFLNRIKIPKERQETADIELVRPEICQWKPKVHKNQQWLEIEPRVWDFGGQLIKHGVHETFLGDDGRTIYILVASANAIPGSQRDHTDEEIGNHLAYWLHMIRHFGSSSAPVIIAITQADAVKSDSRPIDQELAPHQESLIQLGKDRLNEEFDVNIAQIVDNLSACKQDNNFIEPLRMAIVEAVANRDGIFERKVSKELNRLREHVAKELPKFSLVSLSNFRRWCMELSVTNPETQNVLRDILHRMGYLFYFGRDRHSDLDQTTDHISPGQKRLLGLRPDHLLSKYIINPAWLKRAVYQVFEATKGIGWLSPDEVQMKVQAADELVRQHDPDFQSHDDGSAVVEAVLKLVELSFYDENIGKFLFPRGLPRDYSGYSDWPTAWMQWRFIPESAFHRFLVRQHNDGVVTRINNTNNEGRYNHGRNWVHCTMNQIEYLVSFKEHENKIEIRCPAQTTPAKRQELFNSIRHSFVGKSLIGLEPVKEQPWDTGVENFSLSRQALPTNDLRCIIISGFLVHHQYENEICNNNEPVVVSQFAKDLKLSDGSNVNRGRVSEFLKKEFESGYIEYVKVCKRQTVPDNKGQLVEWLRKLDNELNGSGPQPREKTTDPKKLNRRPGKK